MSENYELIAGANLPTTDAAEVDVICVEGGELKRKPGASLGGGGGGYVINIDPSVDIIDRETGTIMMSGSYDDFAPILYAGGSVWVNVANVMEGDIPAGTIMNIPASMFAYIPGMGLQVIALNIMTDAKYILMFMNGSWTPPTA